MHLKRRLVCPPGVSSLNTNSQQYLLILLFISSQKYLFKTFIYRFTTVIKYDLQNLQNLEFPNPAKPAKPTKPRVPIPFKPLFNSQWYMFLNQLFDSQ